MKKRADATGDVDRSVAVLLPVHNAAPTIANTLASLAEQRGANFSILVYDDGSTDATPEVIQEFARGRPDVILNRNIDNRGRGYARNALLEMATGHLVSWQDGDDIWSAGKLAAQAGFYDQMVAEMGATDFLVLEPVSREIAGRGGVRKQHLRPPRQVDVHHVFGEAYKTYPFQLQATFGPVEVFTEAGGFDPNMNWAEDFDIFLKILRKGFPLYVNTESSECAIYAHGLGGTRPMMVEQCQTRIRDRHRDFAAAHGYDLDRIYDLRGAEYLAYMYRAQKRYKEAFRIYRNALAACDFDHDRDRIEAVMRNILKMLDDVQSGP